MLPTVKIEISGTSIIDVRTFMRKWKAVIIEIIGNEIKGLNTDFGERTKTEIEQQITNKSFFPLNRKIRNNLHYRMVENLSSEEISIIDCYQNLYLQIFESTISKQLNISIDKECKNMTNFLRKQLTNKEVYT